MSKFPWNTTTAHTATSRGQVGRKRRWSEAVPSIPPPPPPKQLGGRYQSGPAGNWKNDSNSAPGNAMWGASPFMKPAAPPLRHRGFARPYIDAQRTGSARPPPPPPPPAVPPPPPPPPPPPLPGFDSSVQRSGTGNLDRRNLRSVQKVAVDKSCSPSEQSTASKELYGDLNAPITPAPGRAKRSFSASMGKASTTISNPSKSAKNLASRTSKSQVSVNTAENAAPKTEAVEERNSVGLEANDAAKATKLREAKAKLRNAQAKLVTALETRRKSLSPATVNFPPISALNQTLRFSIISGPAELVRVRPEITLLPGPCDSVAADESDSETEHEEEPSKPDLLEKGEALRKSLLLLKKKKLELTRKIQRRESSPPDLAGEEVQCDDKDSTPRLSKEALKKRQEELQQTVDAAYWKRLVLKQRNLLADEEEKVSQQQKSLEECEEQIANKKEAIAECEKQIKDFKVREECLDEMITKVTKQVLDARKARHIAKLDEEKATKKI